MTMLSVTLMSRFGKPQLVRETSKIYTNNYALIPGIWMRKMFRTKFSKFSEADLLKGVILDKKLED